MMTKKLQIILPIIPHVEASELNLQPLHDGYLTIRYCSPVPLLLPPLL